MSIYCDYIRFRLELAVTDRCWVSLPFTQPTFSGRRSMERLYIGHWSLITIC
ncbi:hypothetical protein [Dactylococcopsis salina]|uniref:hypothetical protein n=1 Tax=Dactylococcopsis salina TaxID=292566 RepID=UPI0012EA95FF|nr:hypothetical protein [Dactylococcopsis salina]